MRFYERFYSFRALSIIGKCTSRHLFAYGGLVNGNHGNLSSAFMKVYQERHTSQQIQS